jgi:hypothetical protein
MTLDHGYHQEAGAVGLELQQQQVFPREFEISVGKTLISVLQILANKRDKNLLLQDPFYISS